MNKTPLISIGVLFPLCSVAGSLLAQEVRQDLQVVEVLEQRADVFRFGSNSASRLIVTEQVGNPNSLADFIDRSPAIARAGQSGLFQVFSIRGVSGQRVQTRFQGIPVNSDRRAGTAASFIDPWFLEQVDAIRGPASTFFGSGAIGGVVLSQARFLSAAELELAYQSDSSQRHQAVGMGGSNWSIGVSNRSAADGEDPQGNLLHSGFQQSSLLLQNRTRYGGWEFDSLWLNSRGEDIGRSNNLYPARRVADILEEDHDLASFSATAPGGWRAQLYFHDHGSVSETLNVGSTLNEVDNSSTDWGVRLNSDWRRQAWSGEFGAETDIRDGVESFEAITDLGDLSRVTRVNLDATQRRYAIFATAGVDLARQSIQFGIRKSWIRQDAGRASSATDNNLTGYIGWQWFIDSRWTLSAELASAYRTPSLSERYFTGTTGRGFSIGNPALEQEIAPGVDLGIHRQGPRTNFSAHVFHQRFDDFIERIQIDEFTRGFANLREGRISGVELEGDLRLNERWRLHYNGSWIEGGGTGVDSISDIPAAAVNVGTSYSHGRWQLGLHWQHRFEKSDVATTEQELDKADIVDLDLRYRFGESSYLALYARNALNDSYRLSADEISTLGNRAVLGLRLNHRFE